ncbi:SusE domain-containing protein [Flavobacterium silvaticum]|uniref:SusE outer membrane protein domain-containing protein n=1 Tax=Flavobacterium silvaticum TaxID=1852020 RepID=A0A972JFF8_9FLAO|nr:SusE domain-containing protein [Flavobacterium silvaticum]NMH27161.1 hypothetical protein [Flavobacterium silvaticum]
MKKLSFLLMGLLVFGLNSCSDDDPAINIYGDEQIDVAPVLEVPTPTDYVVVEDTNEAEQAGTFNWSAAELTYNGAVSYYVQLAPAGSDFVNATLLSTSAVTDLTKSFTFLDLNVALNNINSNIVAAGGDPIDFTMPYSVDVRVMAISGASEATAYSNLETITIAGYEDVFVPTPQLFLVGAVQSYYGLGGWDNTTAMPMRYIGDGTTQVFEAYVKVAAGDGFKFIGQQGSWDNGNYGTIGGAQDGNLENSGGSGDIKVAATDGDGFYYVQVDIDNLTYKAVKMNWGIIGAATAGGWTDETAMNYDFASNTYSLTATVTDGEMKLRSKNTGQYIYSDDWKFNVGNSDPMVTYNPAAPNFTVTGGSHDFTLSLDIQGTATVGGM